VIACGDLWQAVHMAESNSPIRVRLDPDIRARLDRFQIRTHRNLTQSVNLLIGMALDVTDLNSQADNFLARMADDTDDPKGATA
jgi:hypothetical protein